MKYAYYEAAKDENEKEQRLRAIKDMTKDDPNYYSSYIDVVPRYTGVLSERRSYRSLKAAVRRGAVDIVVIPDMRSLQMQTSDVLYISEQLMRLGARIAFGRPDNIQDSDSLIEECWDVEDEYIDKSLFVPLFTMDDCYVNKDFVYLDEACLKRENSFASTYHKRTFIDVVHELRESGFFIYRPDVSSWYHVSSFMAERMIKYFDLFYQTLFESMDLSD